MKCLCVLCPTKTSNLQLHVLTNHHITYGQYLLLLYVYLRNALVNFDRNSELFDHTVYERPTTLYLYEIICRRAKKRNYTRLEYKVMFKFLLNRLFFYYKRNQAMRKKLVTVYDVIVRNLLRK